MLVDEERLRQDYDEQVRLFGEPILRPGIYDRRVLVPRSAVPHVAERDAGMPLTLEHIDAMASDGLFTWLEGAGDGTELGVPMYVAGRIGLFSRLRANGWNLAELRETAEWEEWLVDDCLTAMELPYVDDDASVVARKVGLWVKQLDDEAIGRRPREEWPEGWYRESSGGTPASLSDQELAETRARLARFLAKVERTDLATASEAWRHRISREAHVIRNSDEFVRIIVIHGDRAKLEAGFSVGVTLTGHKCFPFPEAGDLEGFGIVDWHGTLKNPRFLDDPDRYIVRVPGFVLIGGRISLDTALAPDEYARRFELFRLPEYQRVFESLVSSRRCAHCARRLQPKKRQASLYCSSNCSAAARQKRHRERAKARILRFRRDEEP